MAGGRTGPCDLGRGPKKLTNTRILQAMVFGIYNFPWALVLGCTLPQTDMEFEKGSSVDDCPL